MFSSKDPIEKNIKLADDLGLKENEKARFINLMVQKDFEKELVQKDFEKEKELVQKDFEKEKELVQKDFEKALMQKDFEKELVQKDFEKELVQKDFEKELVQKDFEMKTSCLVALHRRQLSAISKRFVGIISEKVL